MISDVQDIITGGGNGPSCSQVSADSPVVTVESIMNADQKKKKSWKRASETFKRPDGMNRELFNLLRADANDPPPLVPSLTPHKLGGYKNSKARLGMKRARSWLWTPFKNPARNDGLTLHHWRRADKLDDEYAFAKFNKAVDCPTFTDEEYTKLLALPNWSREETDHLLQLCQRFDLRWIIIQDRWDRDRFSTPRSVEDLKERYYNLCNALIKAHTPAAEQPQLLCFDAEHERRRKEQLVKLWNRTDEQMEEEEELVAELKKIEARRKERERKAQDLQKLITAADRAPSAAPPPAAALKKKLHKTAPARPGAQPPSNVTPDVTSTGVRFPEYKGPGPHMRSQRMKIPQQIGQKKLKAVEQAIDKLQLEPLPIATEEMVTQFNELRSDVVLLYELKAAMLSCEFDLEAVRHTRLAATGQDMDIPVRLRVSSVPSEAEQQDAAVPKRPVTDAMDMGAGSLPPRRRKLVIPDQSPNLLKRLRR